MITSEEELQIAEMYQQGLSYLAIKSINGRSVNCIQRVVRKHSLQRPSPRDKRTEVSAFTSLDSESVYWLGFIAADGHIRYDPGNHKYALVVEVNKKDEGHIDKLRTFIGFGSKIYRTRDDCVIYDFSSKPLCNNLIQWINPNNKTEMDNFVRIPDDLKKFFVAGYIDGDGHISKYVVSITACPQAIETLVPYIENETGLKARIHLKTGNKAVNACFGGKMSVEKIIQMFGCEYVMERKWK